MTEPFFQQAAKLRDRYVSFFRSAIDNLRSSPNFAVELLTQPNGRDTPEPFCLMRLDAIHGLIGKHEIQRIADSLESAPKASFRLSNGLEVRQDDFSWEALRLIFSLDGFEVQTLRDWLLKWLDPEETRKPDSWGLSGVVHDLAWSLTGPDIWCLDLDFGSAPISALEELLTQLSAVGVKRVTVARHDETEA
ncbi:MAG: hypothetical protein DPW14_16345 [Planctomycetes bacterium]|nr:hypothetical protein [Planctomycetota bacterium]